MAQLFDAAVAAASVVFQQPALGFKGGIVLASKDDRQLPSSHEQRKHFAPSGKPLAGSARAPAGSTTSALADAGFFSQP